MKNILASSVFVVLLSLGFSGQQSALAQTFKPAQPQPAADALKPGLGVVYFYHKFRHIDEMVDWESYKEGEPGEPILELNYRAGQGNVLTSNFKDGVAARMAGFIQLSKSGIYAFSFQSNDGVRLEIDGQMILEDPDVHKDRFSDVAEILVDEPGWYPITVRYFERKNTSTLEFYWLGPDDDSDDLKPVPGEVLAHVPDG